jgi:type II secretory pathway pseudopilin PulG
MIQRPIPLAKLHMSPVPRRQGGFTFLWLLFLVAGLGVGMAATGTLWHTAAQREKEQQLLFVGNEYRRAIESFLKIPPPPGQQARLPKSLDELLLDPRFQHTVRHLRRLYPDPITGNEDWGLLKDAQGGIGGVFSLSEAKPMKTAGFAAANTDFAGKDAYWQWRFVLPGIAVIEQTPPFGSGESGDETTGESAKESATASLAGTTLTPADTAAPIPAAPPQQSALVDNDSGWRDRVFACQRTMELDYRACTAKALGSAAVLNTCVEAMTQRHQACLAGE